MSRTAAARVDLVKLPEFLRSATLAEFIATGLDKLAQPNGEQHDAHVDAIGALYAHAAAEIRKFAVAVRDGRLNEDGTS